jgi:uronate dehydrogenase
MTDEKPILLTGAAGTLGRWLRPRLIDRFGALLSSDIVDGGETHANERFVRCDLADGGAVDHLVSGCRAIIHFGGISNEKPFVQIMTANILGTYNVFEAAHRHGVRRIVFASSNHVIGFHTTDTRLDATSAMRPDTYYGVSKAFGENLASLYVDKHGFDVACLRIGSALPEPKVIRALSTWLSYPDLFQMVVACLTAPRLGLAVVYGASANTRSWWDNAMVAHVGFNPQQNAEAYAGEIMPTGVDDRDPRDPATRFQGGPFCSDGYDNPHDADWPSR